MHKPRFFCMRCSLEMVIKQTGACLCVKTADDVPYYNLYADIYACPSCGAAISHNARDGAAHHSTDAYKLRTHTHHVNLQP